jgi:tetratricopeptide (TPR) repeat protein
MAKKPKGLVKAEKSKSKEVPEFDLNSLTILDQPSFCEAYDPDYNQEERNNDPRWTGYELSRTLARDIAEVATGYSHSSDFLDKASDKKFREYSKSFHRKNPKDADYEYEMERLGIYRGDYYDEVKESFEEKIQENFESSSLTQFESFKKLYKLAKKMKFKGSAEDFEKLLKNSTEFKNFCKKTSTAYTG